MVYETRSRSKVGSDEDNTSKNRVADGEETSISGSRKTGSLDSRRSSRKTPSKQITTTSPSSTRKSERLQKQTPPVTSSKGKSGRLEKSGKASPLKRSDRGKRKLFSSSSSSKLPEEESNSSGTKTSGKKKRKKQLTMESENVSTSSKQSLSSIGKKRKANARSYMFFLKMRRRRGTLSGINKSKRPHKFSGGDGSDTRNAESKLAGDKENGDSEFNISVADELIDQLAAQVGGGASKGLPEACPDKESLNIPYLAGGHEKHFFAGSCVSCSKQQRVGHASPKVELCSCLAMPNTDCDNLSSPKDGVGAESIVISGSAEKYSSGPSKGAPSDHVERNENVCAVCKQGGESLLCNGKGCKRCYHPPSLCPPIHDVPPGVWYCFWCLKKKIESGVHSVTKGVESIWDAREVDVSGTHRQKQYLVKYIGLAHVHNHWVSEAQLLHEAPSLVASFNDKNQVIRWNAEWAVPHRLLKKRLLSFSELRGDCHNLDADANSECQYEWLVKWRGLDYENATWELENANFLCSPHGQSLIREYEIRQEKAKEVIDKNNKQSLLELSKILAGSSLVADIDILNSVNKVQDCWCKSQNASFYDDQEQIVKIVLFILSVSTVCWPVLIITSPDAISHWEAEFMKWAPSVDFVVYCGSRETRKSIETLEFYSLGGCLMLRVLLTSLETAVEDVHILNSLSWEVVVIDQCQQSKVSAYVEQIKTLAGLKFLLFNGPIKHTASEYLNLLSLVDSDSDFDNVDLLKSYSNDILGQLKERFSWFTSYNSKWTSSEFLEYWVPVQISKLQLELYCDALLLNINALCSNSKCDKVGALNDILLTVRKCCDHPYMIWDPSMNPSNKGLSPAEILDVGIKASGKLQLLEKMLYEMKCRQLRTVVLFQSFVGSAPSIGDILDDFLRQKFGEISYERIDAILSRPKKDSALNRFNNVENGRFVFLLENRACKSRLRLSSVDNVIIYGSDTNPLNDLRLLEKLSFDSESKQIKVFRLYSCFTVEEQTLVMAKQEPDHLHSLSRNLNTNLMWGASDMFRRLDEYHGGDNQTPTVDISTGKLDFGDVTREFSTIISESSEKANIPNSVISKVLHSSSHYISDHLLFGEQKIKCTGEEEPCVFWKKLLEGRNPQWSDINKPSPRKRKRVQFFDESPQTPEIGNNEVVKKCRKISSGLGAISVQPECEGGQDSASKEGPSTVRASNKSLPASAACENEALSTKHTSSSQCSLLREVDMVEPAERITLSDEQSSLHIYLRAEMAKVFEVLKLPEDVKKMGGKFLEYVMENHRISREQVNIFHALQISLCWTAASILKQKVDKEKTLLLAKERLKFECTEDEATTVYLKLRALKKNFLQQMKRNDSTSNSLEHSGAGKKGEEHIVDEVLLVEKAKEFPVGRDHPPEVRKDAPNVVAGYDTAEANTIAEGSPQENFTPVNRTELTNIAGNQKEAASNSSNGNQTLQEVTSSDDGGLLPQNQCNGTHLRESQSTSQTEAGLGGPINARQGMCNCEARLAENSERQQASDAGGRPPVACNQEVSGLPTSRPPPQLVESGTVIQLPHGADSQGVQNVELHDSVDVRNVTFGQSRRDLLADPLYNEFDRIRGEIEHATKSHEDSKLQLQSDCEKEIEEAIAEIRKKYNARLQEADTRYSLRKNELSVNLRKVLLNKLLADTFSSKCVDVKSSRIPVPGVQQAMPTSFTQHLRQVSTQPKSRPGLSSASQQTSTPASMRPPIASSSAGEQTLAPACTRLPSAAVSSTSAPPKSSPVVHGSLRRPPSSIAVPPSKSSPVVGESPRRSPLIAQPTSSPGWMRSPSIALSSGGLTVPQTPAPSRSSPMIGISPRIPNRPPLISSITPSSGNARLGGDIRAPAPHLQSFRPSISVSAASPSPIVSSSRPRTSMVAINLPSSSSLLNHVPIQPVVRSQNLQSQNSQHKELHANFDRQPNSNLPKQSGGPRCSVATNIPTQLAVSESPRLSQKTDHQQLPNNSNPQNQPSEPDKRASPGVNVPHLSATELLRNLDNLLRDLDIQASANQQKQGGGPPHSIAANSSSSPSPSPNDFNLQNQPGVNTLPFSELLRNIDNQASAKQPKDLLPPLPEHGANSSSVADTSNLVTLSSVQEGGSSTSSAVSIDVVDVECVSIDDD